MKAIAALVLLFAVVVEARTVRVRLFTRSQPDAAVLQNLKAKFPIDRNRIAIIPLEQYVAFVLAGEASVMDAPEALRAMAIVARTFAMHYSGRHEREGFDLCDTTHCQDLRANVAIKPALQEAVDSTEGQILRAGRSPAATYYHRHCGGSTASADEVWPGMALPYLQSRPDTWCIRKGTPRWKSEIRAGDPGAEARVVSRTQSGRVERVDLKGSVLTAEQFAGFVGERFGWNILRSNRYEIASGAQVTRIDGIGYGHGVGLCQAGAQARAQGGHTFDQILAFYYPGTKLGWAGGPEDRWHEIRTSQADIAAPDAASARDLAEVTERALAEVSRLGLAAPERPRVRTYPTIARYRDATGAQGWIAATTVGRTVRLQPLGVLRSQGVLHSTVMHELLHIAVDEAAHPSTPWWFREGLTLVLSAPNGGRPGSGQAPQRLRRSYAEAESRMRSLLARHGRATVLQWLRAGAPAEVTRNAEAGQTRPGNN